MAKNQGTNRSKQVPSKKPAVNPVSAASVSTPPLKSSFAKDTLRKEEAARNLVKADFVFGKRNYQIMIAGLVVIVIGFFLMSGTTDIMSSTKIVVAPILVLLGFAVEFYAILAKPVKSA